MLSSDDASVSAAPASFDGASGIAVRHTPSPDVDIDVDGATSLLTLHRRLLAAGLDAAVVAVVSRLDAPDHPAVRTQLREQGVDALDGHLATVLARAATTLDTAATAGPATASDATASTVEHALTLLERLGDGTVDGLPSTLADLEAALPPLLAGSSVTPTVAVRLGVGWVSCRREHRERVLQWLAQLALGAHVELIVSEAAARRIEQDHRTDVPAHLLTSLRNRGRSPPAPIAGEPTTAVTDRQTRVAEAMDALDRSGRPFGVLEALARAPTHTRSYEALTRTMALNDPPYEAVRTLATEYGLVERADRADTTTVVSLRPAGLDVIRRLSASAAVSDDDLVGARADGGSSVSTGVSEPPQNSPSMPYSPDKVEGDPPSLQTTLPDITDRDTSVTDTTPSKSRIEGWQTGLVTPEWAPRSRWLPAVTATDPGTLAFVSADLELDIDRDGRTPAISWCQDRETVYVGAEYHNPMQAAVTLAHGLTAEQLWSRGEFATRIGEGLDGLSIQDHDLLRNATRIGWLPNDVQSGADIRDQLRTARDEVLSLSRELAQTEDPSDRTAIRSELAATAIGLVGVVVHLLDLAGVEVVLDYRIADLPRHFSDGGNSDRRADLVAHLRQLTAICSRAGAWTGYAQLIEHRDHVRADGWSMDASPGVDVATPVCGLLVHGGGVEQLSDDVTAACADSTIIHPDAPPLRLDVDLQVGADHHHRAATARQMLQARNLRPTCTATAILAGMFTDPFALATAIYWGLARETTPRDIYLDEVRRVLATASPEHLLPRASPSARAGIATLARAEEPLSQAELCRRAGISTQSWRNHRTGLVAADWVRDTEGGWRLALPFRHERHTSITLADPPWWLRADGSGLPSDYGRESRRTTDVLAWLLFQRGLLDDPDRLSNPTDPIGRAWAAIADGVIADRDLFARIFEQLGVPPPLVRAGCGVESVSSVTTVSVGARQLPRQSSLPVSDTPQNLPTSR